jgi:hypothetical protein
MNGKLSMVLSVNGNTRTTRRVKSSDNKHFLIYLIRLYSVNNFGVAYGNGNPWPSVYIVTYYVRL